jgi:23S rRNA (guanosine2251-2'-O)-methyltransferase
MAGNSARRGAKRNPGSKKGASVGTGGQRRKGLQGKGPTPKATERTSHPASRRAASAKRAESKHPTSATRPSSRASSPRSRGTDDAPETVSGRNPVVEALRAKVPASALYIAERIDSDDRVRESLKLAGEARIPVLEAPRGELDRLGGLSPHQGLVLQVPAYEYAHPDDFLTVGGSAPALVVALDGVTDPRNLGAVLRSTAAFGGHGVVVPARRSYLPMVTWG